MCPGTLLIDFEQFFLGGEGEGEGDGRGTGLSLPAVLLPPSFPRLPSRAPMSMHTILNHRSPTAQISSPSTEALGCADTMACQSATSGAELGLWAEMFGSRKPNHWPT